MAEFKVFDNHQSLLDAELNQSLIITGGSLIKRQRIFQLLKRFGESSRYSEVEQDYFGESGINISFDNTPLKSTSTTMISIESTNDLLELFTFKKGGLLEQNIDFFLEDINILTQFNKVEDELLLLESQLNHLLSQITQSIRLTTKSLDYKKWLLKELDIHFNSDNSFIPDYLIEPKTLLIEAIDLLKPLIQKSTKKYFFIFHRPESMFDEEEFLTAYHQLTSLAQDNSNLKIIIIHENYCFNYGKSEIDNIVVPTALTDQFPDFYLLKESILRHYPQNTIPNDQKLVDSLFRIIHLVDNPQTNYSINQKDMVLLKVINMLMNFPINHIYQDQEISNLEAAFLKIENDF